MTYRLAFHLLSAHHGEVSNDECGVRNRCITKLRRSLFLLEGFFTICRLDKSAPIPDWANTENCSP